MLDIFLEKLKKILNNRTVPLLAIFLAVFFILIRRSFQMQIASQGAEDYVGKDTRNTQERDITSTRGNFYDRNGVQLSENVQSYSVVMSNTALVTENDKKNAMVLQLVQMLSDYGYEPELDFGIDLVKEETEEGTEYSLAFNVEGNALLRFKKNAYCKTSVNKLSEAMREASAEEVFDFLRYGDKENGPMFEISDDYGMEDAYKIMVVRYNLMILNPQWSQFTLATKIDERTAAAVRENMADIPGIEVKQTMSRVYYDSEYFAHIIGYTGKINASELESLNEERGEEIYKSNDVIGKTGMEKSMEAYLAGEKGVEQLTVSSSNKILESKITKAPVAGNDIYLSIDRDLQVAGYHILERNIAAILISKINNGMSYGTKGEKASGIEIPIYEVYNALIYNNVIDIKAFKSPDASDLEKRVLGYFEAKRASIYDKFRQYLAIDNTVTNAKAGEEMEEYLNYVYSTLISSDVGLLVSSAIDRTDSVYLDYSNGKISLSRFLQYAISKNWVDLSKLGQDGAYYDNSEWYSMLVEYVLDYFRDDKEFEKKLYRTLIFTKKLTGTEICLLLFEQDVLEYNEDDVRNLKSGRISAYNFMIQKLTNLEITPAQLALEPCSGSLVITDVKTGEVLAMVTYPSYDNNMLANKIDYTYYSKLLEDNSRPLINRPTQQRTTTGSTFKPLMSFVGFGEGRITTTTKIQDHGIFEEVEPSPKCWKYPGSHGSINVTSAIQHSCNYFFYRIGYDLSLDARGNYNDAKGISTIQKYAAMFGLAEGSGVEVYEERPEISNRDVVRTAIGYYHNFTPTQISKYITTVANSGICYDLTLLDRVMDRDGRIVYMNEPSVHNEITMFSSSQWRAVQLGMYNVVNTSTNSLNRLYGDLGVKVAGKTGTAQVSTTHPNHALFAAYAPYDDPEISVIIVIPNGYSSANSAYIGREVMGLYFNGENKEALLSGEIKAGNATTIRISD
ncbi:MAG: peptidoglycan glycosyltransferase [Lachnospiraceae bacterium]|nr:peptidoglycan glycosyltransferase [Lachnospiraceae bacterium]